MTMLVFCAAVPIRAMVQVALPVESVTPVHVSLGPPTSRAKESVRPGSGKPPAVSTADSVTGRRDGRRNGPV
jgi:hypothetical protein